MPGRDQSGEPGRGIGDKWNPPPEKHQQLPTQEAPIAAFGFYQAGR
jgi:hypothetical protein